jgi:putative SOS response-associated peptidase YedK
MSVVTTPPGHYMGKFHDRSPLILEGEAALAWMQPGMQAEDLRVLLKPYESEHLEAYRVSTVASQARNKTEEVIRPIAAPVPQKGTESIAPVTFADASSQPMLPGLLS